MLNINQVPISVTMVVSATNTRKQPSIMPIQAEQDMDFSVLHMLPSLQQERAELSRRRTRVAKKSTLVAIKTLTIIPLLWGHLS